MRNLRPVYYYTRSCRRISKSTRLFKKPLEDGKILKNLAKEEKLSLKNVDKLKNKSYFENYVTQVSDFSKGLVDSAAEFTAKSYEKVTEGTAEVGKMLDQTLEKSKELAGSTFDLTKKGIEQIGETASTAAQMTIDKSKELADSTLQAMEKFGETASSAAQTTFEKSKELAESTADLTAKSFKQLSETTSTAAQMTFDKSKEILGSTAEFTVKTFEKLGESTSSVVETTMSKTKELADSTVKTVESLGTTAFEKTKEITDETAKTFGKIYDDTASMAQTSLQKTKEIAGSVADSSMKSLEKIGEAAASTTQSTIEKSQKFADSASRAMSESYDQASSMAQSTLQSVNSQLGPTLQSIQKTSQAILASKPVEESMKHVNKAIKAIPIPVIKIKKLGDIGLKENEETTEKSSVNLVKKKEVALEKSSVNLIRMKEAALVRFKNKPQRLSLMFRVVRWIPFNYLPSQINPISRIREKVTEKLHKFGNFTRGITGYYVGDGWKHDIRNSEAATSAVEHFVNMTSTQLAHHLHHVTVVAVFAAALSTGFEIKRGFKLDVKEQTSRHKLETGAHIVSSFGGSYFGSKMGAIVGEALMPGLGTLFFGLLGAFHCSSASIFATKLFVEKFIKK